MAKDALTAHARDELGVSENTTARPVQAALTPAVTFSTGAAMPLLMVVVSTASLLVPIVSAASLGFLADRRWQHCLRGCVSSSCNWRCLASVARRLGNISLCFAV
jgi:hypothetical protein